VEVQTANGKVTSAKVIHKSRGDAREQFS
jgi:hypothetical protein